MCVSETGIRPELEICIVIDSFMIAQGDCSTVSAATESIGWGKQRFDTSANEVASQETESDP